MLNFKKWLMQEDVEYMGDLTGDLFNPTNADDYHYSNSDPNDLWWLQWKWEQEKNQGLEFIGIDLNSFQKIRYLSLKSNTAPNDKNWVHKNDERPNFDVIKTDLSSIGFNGEILKNNPMVVVKLPLEKMFGDKESGNWQKAAIDQPWH